MPGHADIYCWENLGKLPLNRGKTRDSYTFRGNSGQISNLVVLAAPIVPVVGAAASDPEPQFAGMVANSFNTRIALPTAQTTILLENYVKITGRILLDQGSQQSLIKK